MRFEVHFEIRRFHFGTDTARSRFRSAPRIAIQTFYYQELIKSFLVWHATCIRTGQHSLKKREQGSDITQNG
jgi:hypothetical protein